MFKKLCLLIFAYQAAYCQEVAQLSKPEILKTAKSYENYFDKNTVDRFTDFDQTFDFVTTKDARFGILLLNRYEVVLADSWGKKRLTTEDLGAIVDRSISQGFAGTPPLQNTAKANGLKQHIKISFQAPTFDLNGKLIKNAVVQSVIINNVLVQQNVELGTPINQGTAEFEVVQKNVAAVNQNQPQIQPQNMQTNVFDLPAPSLANLSYKVYEGEFKKTEDMQTKASKSGGSMEKLTYEVIGSDNNFGLSVTGNLKIPVDGTYEFSLGHGGTVVMTIDGKEVFKEAWGYTTENRKAKVSLTAGDHTINLGYIKTDGWVQPRLALAVASDRVRETEISGFSSGILPNPASPILIKTETEPIIHRSFMDYAVSEKENKRITKAVSVGTIDGIHFTYDLESAHVFQVWKGDFLDATPMWNDRGDGSSKPLGSVIKLGLSPSIAALANESATWPTENKTIVVKGYELDEAGTPTFKTIINGTMVADKITIEGNGKSLARTISTTGTQKLTCKLAEGSKIEEKDGMYLVDGQYFIKSGPAKIRTSNGKQELIAEINGSIAYSIVW